MNNIIFLFGASCSGKSTLGLALQKTLGNKWTYIDRDKLIERNVCTDSTADAAIEERIRSIKNNIIVDAQIPWRAKRKGEFYFMVLPPLQVLLERDAIRTARLKRSKEHAHYAREYVIETYNTLSSMEKTDFNRCFDSSKETVQDEVTTIQSIISHRPDSEKSEIWQEGSPNYLSRRNASVHRHDTNAGRKMCGKDDDAKNRFFRLFEYKYVCIAIAGLALSLVCVLFQNAKK